MTEYDAAGKVTPSDSKYWDEVSAEAEARFQPDDDSRVWNPAPSDPAKASEDNPATDDWETPSEWFGETPRERAIRELAAEFGTDESEWF